MASCSNSSSELKTLLAPVKPRNRHDYSPCQTLQASAIRRRKCLTLKLWGWGGVGWQGGGRGGLKKSSMCTSETSQPVPPALNQSKLEKEANRYLTDSHRAGGEGLGG